jgi:hypothetical protein
LRYKFARGAVGTAPELSAVPTLNARQTRVVELLIGIAERLRPVASPGDTGLTGDASELLTAAIGERAGGRLTGSLEMLHGAAFIATAAHIYRIHCDSRLSYPSCVSGERWDRDVVDRSYLCPLEPDCAKGWAITHLGEPL